MNPIAVPTLAEVAALRAERYNDVSRETRSGGKLQLRKTDSGDWEFDGYACTFNQPYEVEDWLGTYTEEFASGAFTKTLAERDDVAMLINHEGLPLARTSSRTLSLTQDDHGLGTATTLAAGDPDVQRLVPKMQRGDLSQMSIAFRAMRQEWNDDYTQRTVIEAKLYDVSIVTYPANPFTTAAIRSGIDLLEDFANLNSEDLLTSVRSARLGDQTQMRATILRAARIATQLLPVIGRRAEADGSDEAAEEAEEISDLTVLKAQLDAAGLLVDQMLAEEAEDAPAAPRSAAPAVTQRDAEPTLGTMDVAHALRMVELIGLGAR